MCYIVTLCYYEVFQDKNSLQIVERITLSNKS